VTLGTFLAAIRGSYLNLAHHPSQKTASPFPPPFGILTRSGRLFSVLTLEPEPEPVGFFSPFFSSFPIRTRVFPKWKSRILVDEPAPSYPPLPFFQVGLLPLFSSGCFLRHSIRWASANRAEASLRNAGSTLFPSARLLSRAIKTFFYVLQGVPRIRVQVDPPIANGLSFLLVDRFRNESFQEQCRTHFLKYCDFGLRGPPPLFLISIGIRFYPPGTDVSPLFFLNQSDSLPSSFFS